MGVSLEKEPDVCVADSLADHLGAHAGLEGTGGVRVAQVVECDPRQPSCRREAVEALSNRVRLWRAPTSPLVSRKMMTFLPSSTSRLTSGMTTLRVPRWGSG